MITLDFSWKPVVLNYSVEKNVIEETVLPQNAAVFLAATLMQSSENKEKFFDWYMTLYKEQKLILMDSDVKTLRDFVKDCQSMNALIGGQILKFIDKAKDEIKEKPKS